MLRLLLDTTQYVHAASFYQSSASLACVIRSSFDALKTFFLCAVRNTARTENYYQNNQPFWETSLSHINEKRNISSGSLLCPITSKCKASIALTVSSRDMGGLCLRPGADICQMQTRYQTIHIMANKHGSSRFRIFALEGPSERRKHS